METFVKSPAFQFYPSDWLGSRAVRLMDAEQRGWYIQLLAESWESDTQGTLPTDDHLLRVLAGANTCSTDVEERWAFVKAQFKQKGKFLYNERILDEVAKQEENREKKRIAGHASAESRRNKREALKTQHLNGATKRNTRSTPVEIRSASVPTEAQQNSTLQSSSSSSISTSSSENKDMRPAKKPQDDRVGHPAIQAIWKIRGKYPLKALWDSLIEIVGDEPDVGRMKKCWLNWIGKGFNSENYGWLTDWYVNGESDATNRQSNGHQTANERRSASFNGLLSVVQELRDESSGAVSEVVRRKSLTS